MSHVAAWIIDMTFAHQWLVRIPGWWRLYDWCVKYEARP